MSSWQKIKLKDALDYVQPTPYIVQDTQYSDEYDVPVLTPGQSFLLGYTYESDGIYENVPTIIFDDFTTAFKYVDFPFKVKSSAMKMLKVTSDDYDIKFMYYLMQSLNFEASEHKRYWISKYSQQFVKVPPLDQQKKIAAILDAADEYRQKTKALIAKYDELTQSLFLDMFGDFVENPKGFDQGLLGDILPEKNSIKCGPFGSQLKIGEFVEKGIPVYGIDNVQANKFLEAKPKFITDKKYEDLNAFNVLKNDVLISRTGTVGRTCLAPDVLKAVIGPNLLKVRIQNNSFTPQFLAYAFNYSSSIIRQIEMFSPGATVAVYNTGNLKKLKVVVPPLSLQNQFTQRVQAIEAQKAQAEESLSKAEDLFNSLLQRAFKGELTN